MTNFLPLKWHYVPPKWQHYGHQIKLDSAQTLKLFVWFLALIPVAILHFPSLLYVSAFLAALTCFLNSSLQRAFLGSISHHIKTLQGRFMGVVFLCFLPSIIFSAWPGAGFQQLVFFILTLLLLTGLAGIIPLMEDNHRRLFLAVMVWGLIFSFLIFFILYHPAYDKIIPRKGHWAFLQGFYNGASPAWLSKTAGLHLALFFPILLFALWSRLPRRLFLFLLFLFLTIIFLYHLDSRTAIAGLFVNSCVLGAGYFFLSSLSAKQRRYSLFLFLLAIMIPAPIVIENAIKKQKEHDTRPTGIIRKAQKKPPPLGLPIWGIDIHRQIIWLEYIRGWKGNPFQGHGINSTAHEKKVALKINNRDDIEFGRITHKRKNPHQEDFSSDFYYHGFYPYERLMKAGVLSPHKLRAYISVNRKFYPNFTQYYPHNYYIQILFEAGLIGFIPFMAFLIFLFSRSALIFWRSREITALFVLGLHCMFFTEGFFFPRFFSETGLIMYGTAWMVILVLGRWPESAGQTSPQARP